MSCLRNCIVIWIVLDGSGCNIPIHNDLAYVDNNCYPNHELSDWTKTLPLKGVIFKEDLLYSAMHFLDRSDEGDDGTMRKRTTSTNCEDDSTSLANLYHNHAML